MVKVDRVGKPLSLMQNAVTWRIELMEQIRIHGDYSKVPEQHKRHYNREDVKIALEEMFGEKCCFCEGHIGECAYGNIEHRRPKRTFPFLAFNWGNLHWCCPVCNTMKGKRWDAAAPILDATRDDPNQHFEFDLESCKILTKNNSARAETTIKHAGLNREKLITARKRLKSKVIKQLLQVCNMTSQTDRDLYHAQLRELTVNDPTNGNIAVHSMFVKQLLSAYGL